MIATNPKSKDINMKGLFAYALLATVVSAAPRVFEREDDDNCEMVWVTVYGDGPATTSNADQSTSFSGGRSSSATESLAATSSGPAVKEVGINDEVAVMNKVALAPGVHNEAGAATSTDSSSTILQSSPTSVAAPATASNSSSSASDSSSALSLPTRPDGSAPIPINNHHLSAPVAKDPVPAGAATYTPPTAGVFNNTDFAAWMKQQKDANLASKWMVVAAGAYRYAPGPVMPSGTDANTVVGEGIAIYFTTGGWTLDLRGVTFYVDITPENQNQRPGDMIYINQSEDFTILGGTVWIDQGEIWTQARVTSVGTTDSQGNQIATMEVEQGYNVSAWRAAGPRNQGCVDDSDANHFTRPACNFWYVNDYNFDGLESKRTFTASIASRSAIKKGYVITMEVVINSYTTISTENNGNFHVKGFTSNGYVASIGLGSKVAPVFEDVYYVNPPPRPGYAPRVEGPALSWGNIGGPVYNPPGQTLAQLPGSVWQTTGCEKDLQSASNATVPL